MDAGKLLLLLLLLWLLMLLSETSWEIKLLKLGFSGANLYGVAPGEQVRGNPRRYIRGVTYSQIFDRNPSGSEQEVDIKTQRFCQCTYTDGWQATICSSGSA